MMKMTAAIFDLDGVITKTAKVHFSAWKKIFDHFLQQRASDQQSSFQPFTYQDYLNYVDGLPRYKGIKTFLSSRNIIIDEGHPDDDGKKNTVYGLGNYKNQVFQEVLEEKGVEVFPSTIKLIKNLRAQDIKTGVVSSSKSCRMILAKAKIENLFDVRVDGLTSIELHLQGKPEPDIFLKAAERLAVKPEQCMIVEDAISGVQAGSKGGFRFVVGIDRHGSLAETFKQNGAHLVVTDLDQLSIQIIEQWFSSRN